MKLWTLLDLGLVIPILGLAGVSLALIASTTPSLFASQAIFFFIGIVIFVIIASADFRLFMRFSWLFYVIIVLLLIASLISPSVRGSHRWIELGFSTLQPSEISKPFIILLWAYLLSSRKKNRLSFFASPLLLFIPIAFLIFKQPDLGNVLVYFFTLISLYLAVGLPLFYIISSIGVLGLLFPLIWFFLKHYQKTRLLSFLNPFADPSGAGYNAIQAMIALGSGQLMGLGLGRGTQSHLLFLPEYHTDFVFASIVEELGLVGGAVIILFYFLLLGRIFLIGLKSDNEFGKLICIGSFAQIFIQVFINIGMNLGLLPITGITLPLLSSGGSSIISTFICMGLVTSVANKENIEKPIVIK